MHTWREEHQFLWNANLWIQMDPATHTTAWPTADPTLLPGFSSLGPMKINVNSGLMTPYLRCLTGVIGGVSII